MYGWYVYLHLFTFWLIFMVNGILWEWPQGFFDQVTNLFLKMGGS